MSSLAFVHQRLTGRVALSPLLVRVTLTALAAGGLFFNGIAMFAAAAVLIALLIDQWRLAGAAPGLDRAVVGCIAVFLLAAIVGTGQLLLVPVDNELTGHPVDQARILRNLGNAFLIAIIPFLLALRWSPARLTTMAVRADISGPFLIAMGLVTAIFVAVRVGLITETIILPNGFNRVVMHVCILGWFAAAAAGPAGKPRKAAWLIVGLTILSALSESATAALAMMAGSIAFFGCLVFARSWVRLQTILLVAFAAVTPLLGLALPETDAGIGWMPFSWGERLAIWEQVADRFFQRPWIGWGLKSSDVLDWTIPAGYTAFAGRPITHAHNATLQILADFGLIGFAAWLVLLTVVGMRIQGLHRNVRPYACAAFVSAFIVANLAVDFWTDSFLATLALTSLLFRFLSTGMSGDNLKFAFVRHSRPSAGR
jgi:O-antigen ligase